jgi:hypothetical protein
MAKDRVLEITSSGCELKSLHTLGTEVWCARPPENKSNDPDDYEGCHVLQFVNSALSAVNKDISQASGETFADLMNKVYEFTTDAQAVGKTVVIRASHTEEEKQRLRTISISARDGHDLALVIVQAVGGRGWTSQVRLVEILGPTPKPAGALPKKQ